MAAAPAHGRSLPLRSRARVQPARAAAAGGGSGAAPRTGALARHRRHRRLLELGAARFPRTRDPDAIAPAGGTAESTISHVMLQSANDAQAPPVAADRAMQRTTPAVRKLLMTRRGANALLEEAASLGQLDAMPDFALGPSRYPVRPLCGVCGYWGDVACMACSERCCSRACLQVHHDTRCERW